MSGLHSITRMMFYNMSRILRDTLVFILVLFSVTGYSQHLQVEHLTCEYKENPAGIEAAAPGLGWEIISDRRNVEATAYHILVADDPVLLNNNTGNIWDSKKVHSNQSIQIPYGGGKLLPATNYYWKVMVWDNFNQVSPWSEVAHWQMGLTEPADWKGANWIGYDQLADSNLAILPVDGKKDTYTGNNLLPLMRKTFKVRKPIKQATLFISGLGHFELSINGEKAGDHFLDPGWTKYDQQALYVTFDLTHSLKQGKNALGVMLGNGFYYIPPVSGRYRKTKTAFGYPKMICRLVIRYADGTEDNVLSDRSWRTSKGPITFSSIYGGEDYDANLEQTGWDTPEFQAKKWKKPMVVDGPPLLNAQMADPVKVMEVFSPKQTTQLGPGNYTFDMGQNASGIPMIKVRGHKGDTIKIIPAELLNEDGTANQRSSGRHFYLYYILKGESIETWQPRFTYYGYRYLQIKGAVPAGENGNQSFPELLELKSLHVRNAAPTAGSFSSSSELFNRTNELIKWAINSNMVSLFTDCPHREKLGWLEEAHLMGNSLQYNYKLAQLGRKEVDDMRFSQTDSGLVPEIAPEYVKFEWGGDMFRDSPEWGSSSILMPWYLYLWYGDKKTLEHAYPMMQRYANYLKTKARGHLLRQGLGDWYDLGPNPPGVSQLTPMGVTGTAIYYYDLTIMGKIARLLGKLQDAAGYEQLAIEVRKAFNEVFFNKETKQYATGSQAANAMAVYMQLVEPQHKTAVIENIIKDIRSRNNSLTAGDIGYRYLLKVLHEAGRSDVIFDMNNRSDVPGYGYQLAKGATALTESWAALPANSNNHFMLGHIMEWFYQGLAGINQADGSVAYRQIIIKPEPVGDITSASGSYHSMYGTITSEWKMEGNVFDLHTSIPPNTTATLYLPAVAVNTITENGIDINEQQDIKLVGYENGRALVKLGSGDYHFRVIGE